MVIALDRDKKFLHELVILRAISCLSVVLLHAIKDAVTNNIDNGNSLINEILLSIAGLLSFSTPTFVIISIILLAISSRNVSNKEFYWNKTKAILFPFISMALFYAFVNNYDQLNLFFQIKLFLILLGIIMAGSFC